jgi:uncharacterized protein DUF4160
MVAGKTGALSGLTKDIRASRVKGCPMPTIAYFLGIAVRMFYNDHGLPHFHVRYQGHRALVRIADGVIIEGRLPPAVARILREWTQLRHEALMRNWDAARRDAALERIPGLDDD